MEGIYIFIGIFLNLNIILILMGEIDVYNDVLVYLDMEIYWYYYLNFFGLYFFGVECYNLMYVMCFRLSLNVLDNLVCFKLKGRLVSGFYENGFFGFDFGNESYKVFFFEILLYFWDEGWIDYFFGYCFNGSLVFFFVVIIEIIGVDVKCVDCILGEGVVFV